MAYPRFLKKIAAMVPRLLQSLLLGPQLFMIYITRECTAVKVADDTKIGGLARC